MPVGAAVAGAVVGGILQNRAAGKQAAAMNNQAAAQIEAARIAAEEARFRPVGIKTRFSSATPQFDENGRLSGYDYQASPEIQALQDQLQSIYGSSLGQAERAAGMQQQFESAGQGLMNLGQQFIPTSTTPQLTGLEQEYLQNVQGLGRGLLGDMSTTPSADVLQQQQRLSGLAGQVIPTSYDTTAAARDYYQEQQDIMQPARQREEQRLASSVFGRGRGGLSVGAEGQPELFALGQARAEQDARLAAQSRERARSELQQDISLGSQLGQQAIATGQAGEQYRLGQIGQGLGFMGQGMTTEEAARQRMLQNLETGSNLYTQGAGLFGTGYGLQQASLQPFQSQFGMAQQLEEVAQQPMQIGAALGAKSAAFGGQAGQLLQGGANAAANLQSQAAQAKASSLAGIGAGISNLGTMYGMGMFNPGNNPASTNPMTINLAGGGTFNQGAQVPAGSGGNKPYFSY